MTGMRGMKRSLMNLKRWIGPLLVTSLLVSATAVAFAQEAEATKRGFVGAAGTFHGAELGLEPLSEELAAPPTIVVTEATEIRFPGQEADVQASIDIQVDSLDEAVKRRSKVAIVAEEVNEAWQALQITVLPAQPLSLPTVGAVVSIDDGVLTVQAPGGTTRDVHLGPQDPPDVGEVVAVFAGPTSGGPDGPPVLTGLVRAEEVRQRLQDHLQQIEVNRPELPDEARAERVEELASLLENHASHHVDILRSLRDGGALPEEAVPGITTALENARRGRAEARVRAEEARAKAGPPADRPGDSEETSEGQGEREKTPAAPDRGQDAPGEHEETGTSPAGADESQGRDQGSQDGSGITQGTGEEQSEREERATSPAEGDQNHGEDGGSEDGQSNGRTP